MKLAQALCALVIPILVVGCESSRTFSTVQDEHTAYAISGSEAKRIADDALENYIPKSQVDHTPESGLVAQGSLSDGSAVQIIKISALPVSGVNSAGSIKEGYGFIVSEKGGVVNPLAARMIYSLAKQQAGISGEVLATAKPQQ